MAGESILPDGSAPEVTERLATNLAGSIDKSLVLKSDDAKVAQEIQDEIAMKIREHVGNFLAGTIDTQSLADIAWTKVVKRREEYKGQ